MYRPLTYILENSAPESTKKNAARIKRLNVRVWEYESMSATGVIQDFTVVGGMPMSGSTMQSQ